VARHRSAPCWCARLLALVHAVYFVLDARGSASVIPALICAVFTIAFAITSMRTPTRAS
jgi:hypothetical protein